MMSACSMPSENTGHGVRATQRTNPLTRPGAAAGVLTCSPYRSGASDLNLDEALRTGVVVAAH